MGEIPETKGPSTSRAVKAAERPPANLGQAKLLELKVTLGALAECCGVSRAAAQGWRNGSARPDPARRERIAEAWPEVLPHLWDALPARERRLQVAALDPDVSVKALARDHLELVRSLRERAEAAGRAGEHVKLLDLERKTIMDLARFSEELLASDEDRLVRSVRWQRIRDRLAEVLSPYPDAARALVAALRGLE